MVWSLSKDDDGLESVHPLTNQGATLSSPGDRRAGAAPARPARASSGAPSVFVDPRSQVPQASSMSHPRREEIEPTMVLKGRKLDEMRAEVARQKLSYQRRKQRMLLLWAMAGGAALAMGWFAGILLSPAPTGTNLRVVPTTLSGNERQQVARSAGDVSPERRAESAVPVRSPQQASAVTSLEELPVEDTEPKRPVAPSDRGASRPDEKRTDTSLPRREETFTLDDLPAD